MQHPFRKATCFSLRQKISAFYGTNNFITIYTTASHLSLFSARLIQSRQHILFNVPFNTTIHLVQHLQSSLLSSCFPIKIMYTLIFPPSVSHAMPILSTSISSPENYLISTNHEAPYSATFSSLPLFPPSPALPQRSILKCPQPMSFPQCERPSVHINNNIYH